MKIVVLIQINRIDILLVITYIAIFLGNAMTGIIVDAVALNML